MKKKILWSDFLNPEKKIAINCQTEAEAKEFLQILDAKGVKWWPGVSLITKTAFDDEKENTSYVIDRKPSCPFCLSYDSKKYYSRHGYSVYIYSEVEFVEDDEGEAVENNNVDDIGKSVSMVLDQLKDLQEEAEKKQDEYKDSFVQWAVFQERTTAYKTAVTLLERAIKA